MCVRDSNDYVNYREFKDFKDRIQDQFDKITELVYKEHYQLEEELDEFRKEIKRV